MKLGFSKRQDRSFRNQLMQLGSGGEYVHCQFFLEVEPYGDIVCSAWDVYGVGFRTVAETTTPGDHYTYLDFPIDLEPELILWFRRHQNTAYDLAGLLTSFMIPVDKKQSPAMFCSEVCYHACQEVLKLNLPLVRAEYLSPQHLFDLITAHQPN
jgi:hypothetical protein